MFTKKSLGQHFLNSPHYLALIADTAHVTPGEHVLEVGPGEGALTAELLSRGAVVTAVEKDHRLIPILQEKFAQEIHAHSLRLIEGDILQTPIWDHLPQGSPYKLVANIPYYITGAIVERFLSAEHQPTSMTLLVQKEVAERIARDPKESILSLSVKVYGTPRYIKTVPAGAFAPPPKVDSAILAISDISRAHFADTEQEQRFFELVHAGFAHKRKLLGRNLESVFGAGYATALTSADIAANARAEDIGLEQWLRLSRVNIVS